MQRGERFEDSEEVALFDSGVLLAVAKEDHSRLMLFSKAQDLGALAVRC